MSMTDQELLHLRAYCASVLTKYGFQLSPDNPVTPALYIIHKEMEENNKVNKDVASRINKATEDIKPKVYHFNVAGEAWKFQVGIGLKWLPWGMVILGFVASLVWLRSLEEDVKRARFILKHEPALTTLLQQGKKTSDGYYYIDFKKSPNNKSIQFFTEFEQIDARTVRVYVAKTD